MKTTHPIMNPKYLTAVCVFLGAAYAVACSLDPRADKEAKSEIKQNDPADSDGEGGSTQMGGAGGTGSDDDLDIINIPNGGDANECDTALGPCEAPDPVCGDSIIQDSAEECDDGNTEAGDGCGATCLLEPGWVCPVLGAACQAAQCGDGLLVGLELCDDGNAVDGDGCSADCGFEDGYECSTPGQACTPTECGNGVQEGTEPCDDGNFDLGDGCTPFCQLEPDCSGGACTSHCGDGIKFEDEACDDGNTRDGDGCSSACEVEDGYACVVITEDPPDSLELPIVIRDFSSSHPDMEYEIADDRGLVRATLGGAADMTSDGASLQGKPVFSYLFDANDNCPAGSPTNAGAAPPCTGTVHSEDTFHQWYRDVDGVNQTFLQTLTLDRTGNNVYEFSNGSFFPIDNMGFGNAGNDHNFWFTSEVRYWFQYNRATPPTLNFRGDDDVWVFVNGKLAVDLGGVHAQQDGSITLDQSREAEFGLTDGKIYEIVVFQAERHTTESNYRLTLSNFLQAVSECDSVCGDGIVTRDEACDDGVNDGSYGTCNPDCSRGPSCGDGEVTMPQEACDDGNRKNGDGCSANCIKEAIK